jgi:hypothetical protein
MRSFILSVVPTGEVDSMMNKLPSSRNGIILLVAFSTKEISGSCCPLNGVGTAIKKTSALVIFVEAFSVPESITFLTSPANSGSTICIFP